MKLCFDYHSLNWKSFYEELNHTLWGSEKHDWTVDNKQNGESMQLCLMLLFTVQVLSNFQRIVFQNLICESLSGNSFIDGGEILKPPQNSTFDP